MFLENVFAGSFIKKDLYILGRKYPKTPSENESYIKMKKFEKYEKYPDKIVRDQMDFKNSLFKTKLEMNNEIKNKFPIVTEIRNIMKQGLQMLFQGKELIYKALMKYDIQHLINEGNVCDRESALHFLKQEKHFDLNLSYKDVFGIKPEEVEVQENIEIPLPKLFKKMRVNAYNMDPEGYHPSKIMGSFKFERMEIPA